MLPRILQKFSLILIDLDFLNFCTRTARSNVCLLESYSFVDRINYIHADTVRLRAAQYSEVDRCSYLGFLRHQIWMFRIQVALLCLIPVALANLRLVALVRTDFCVLC